MKDAQDTATTPTSATSADRAPARTALGRGVGAGFLGALGWVALSAGDPASLVVGLPTVLFAALIAARVGREPSAAASSARAESWLAVPTFLLGLVRDVLASATQLALHVFRERLELDPGVVHHRLRLQGAEARAAFMNAVTLTPGTLAADIDDSVLRVHALDRRGGTAAELAALEARIAALYDEPRGAGG